MAASSVLPSNAQGQQNKSTAKGNRQTFHQTLIADILNRSRHYKHRWRRLETGKPAEADTRTKGDAIRARIAANAQKRFEIAEAMKREAGVAAHELNHENGGGIAWSDTQRILAPAGENRRQLYTLAHECGHVFLHRNGTPGRLLPTHVKEMEAERYAHQAFRAHGMQLPPRLTLHGRQYVGQWVTDDWANGILIDQRAVDYAKDQRSPYEPLRAVPDTWRVVNVPGLVLPPKPVDLIKPPKPTLFSNAPEVITEPAKTRIGRSVQTQWALVKRDAIELARYLGFNALFGFNAIYLPLQYYFDVTGYSGNSDTATIVTSAFLGMLLWMCAAMMLKTATIGPDIKLSKTVIAAVVYWPVYSLKRLFIWSSRATPAKEKTASQPEDLMRPLRPRWLEELGNGAKQLGRFAVAGALGWIAWQCDGIELNLRVTWVGTLALLPYICTSIVQSIDYERSLVRLRQQRSSEATVRPPRPLVRNAQPVISARNTARYDSSSVLGARHQTR